VTMLSEMDEHAAATLSASTRNERRFGTTDSDRNAQTLAQRCSLESGNNYRMGIVVVPVCLLAQVARYR
jgi:hypothetical protein